MVNSSISLGCRFLCWSKTVTPFQPTLWLVLHACSAMADALKFAICPWSISTVHPLHVWDGILWMYKSLLPRSGVASSCTVQMWTFFKALFNGSKINGRQTVALGYGVQLHHTEQEEGDGCLYWWRNLLGYQIFSRAFTLCSFILTVPQMLMRWYWCVRTTASVHIPVFHLYVPNGKILPFRIRWKGPPQCIRCHREFGFPGFRHPHAK